MKVSCGTYEWNLVRFRIQLALADPSVQILEITKYSNEFEPKYANYMKIDCGLNATAMQESQVETIKQGNSSRYIYQAGYLRFDRQENRPNKMLLLKLAINHSMPIHKSGSAELTHIQQFPAGIDTIYVSESKEEMNIYPHRYRVKDRSQVCLEYEVDFIRKGMDKIDKWNKQSVLCENCDVAKAIYYCHEDKELYCGRCYEQLHRSVKKKNHQQKKLSPFNCGPHCPFHARQRQTYYCFDCKQLKCHECLQNETHKNIKKHTEIMSLSELEATSKAKQTSFLKQSKDKTTSLISSAEDALNELQNRYDRQKRDLEDKFAAKLSKILEQNNARVMRVVTIHTELRRKLDQLVWVQNYLEYCEDFLMADDNIQMKESFFPYLKRITTQQYFLQISKNLQQSLT